MGDSWRVQFSQFEDNGIGIPAVDTEYRIMYTGYGIQDTNYWIPDARFLILTTPFPDAGNGIRDTEYWVRNTGYWMLNTCQSGIMGVDSSLREGGVLQGLARLDLLLQTIVNLGVSHLLCCLLVLPPLCHWLSTGGFWRGGHCGQCAAPLSNAPPPSNPFPMHHRPPTVLHHQPFFWHCPGQAESYSQLQQR